jgi:hypothetical protein
MTATATPKDDGEQPASVHHGYQGLLRRAGPKNEETDRDDRVNRVLQIARQGHQVGEDEWYGEPHQ